MELTQQQQNRVKEILQKNPDATLTEITAYAYENERLIVEVKRVVL
jgi:sortase (surface protein transpeptidase)